MIALAFVLTACGSNGAELTGDLLVSEVALNSSRPEYVPYHPRQIDSRQGAILFFAKETDPYSIEHDQLLRTLYESGAVSVSTYRVDFASATGARLTYGVITEDTFILLDASGERVGAYTHPSSEEIRILVRGRVPVSPASPAS